MPRRLPTHPGVCQAPGCLERRTTFDGFCTRHYQTNHRYGHPLGKLYAEYGDRIESMHGLIATEYPTRPLMPTTIPIGDADVRLTTKDYDRFLSKIVVQKDGRWVWEGKLNPYGYGVLSLRKDKRGIYIGAHRLAYITLVGPIPEGLDLDHIRHNDAVAQGTCLGGDTCLHRREVDPKGLIPRGRGPNVRLGVHRNQPIPRPEALR